jgi:hypothetical protein
MVRVILPNGEKIEYYHAKGWKNSISGNQVVILNSRDEVIAYAPHTCVVDNGDGYSSVKYLEEAIDMILDANPNQLTRWHKLCKLKEKLKKFNARSCHWKS